MPHTVHICGGGRVMGIELFVHEVTNLKMVWGLEFGDHLGNFVLNLSSGLPLGVLYEGCERYHCRVLLLPGNVVLVDGFSRFRLSGTCAFWAIFLVHMISLLYM